jgi:hypothetical protein
MNRNPYLDIIQLMRKHGTEVNPPSILIAEVVAIPPLLIIKVGNTQIDKKNILISDSLINGYTRQYQSSTLDPASWGTTMQIKFMDTLAIGDKLAVMPTLDGQTFIILCKVVGL